VKGWWILYAILSCAIVAGAIVSLVGSYRDFLRLRKEWMEVREGNMRMEEEIKKYSREVEDILGDTFYREYLIRKTLKMIKPGEKVFRVR